MSSYLVTGGSRGLGLAITEALLDRGDSVRTMARTRTPAVDALVAAHGDRIEFLEGDVAVDADIERFTYGSASFDGLVNNVGVGLDGLLATQGVATIDRLLDVNLRSALLCSKWYTRARLGAREPGSVISISSIIGVRGYSGLAAYAATKAGMLGMTRALARELGPRGFRVNAVLPGYLETELSASLSRRQLGQIRNRTPLGRLGTAADVTPLVLFLLSDASAFITGQEFVVDGGITC